MPDISKLPDLCRILNISFEDLVSERIPETETVEKLLQDENAEVSLEEMAMIGQLVKPDTMESKINDTIKKGGKISFSDLTGLAPFMDKEILGKLAEEIADIDLRKLCGLAPFLQKGTLDKIMDNAIRKECLDADNVVCIAPFLLHSTIQKIAEYFVEHNQAKKLVLIAPFMSKEMFPSQLKDICMDISETTEDDSDAVNSELDDLVENGVSELASKALESGKEVADFLDYMTLDDVAELAFKALEMGKEIEDFLDYMTEDAMKNLLLKAVKGSCTC